jgi:hypothetical protein
MHPSEEPIDGRERGQRGLVALGGSAASAINHLVEALAEFDVDVDRLRRAAETPVEDEVRSIRLKVKAASGGPCWFPSWGRLKRYSPSDGVQPSVISCQDLFWRSAKFARSTRGVVMSTAGSIVTVVGEGGCPRRRWTK